MPQPNLCIINLRDHWPMKTDWQNIWYGMALTALLSDPHPGALRAIRDLQKAQQEFPSLAKTKDVGVGKFGYSYLPLEQMLSKIQPVLHKNNLHISQVFGYTPTGETTIKTKLVHEGGHEEVSELPLFIPPRDMQKKNEAHVWGSSVTYQRRYSIKLILGVETDMDNNMEFEAEKAHKSRQAAPPQNVFIAAKAAI